MRYTCVDTTEFLYPDITEYQSGTESIHILTPRGSYACAQILFSEISEKRLNIRFEGFEPEVYEMVPIFVEENHLLDERNSHPHIPERAAPFCVYDCLKPVKNSLSVDKKRSLCNLFFRENPLRSRGWCSLRQDYS